jgi:pimeloyl-ACP methyl ester carboxylesterase
MVVYRVEMSDYRGTLMMIVKKVGKVLGFVILLVLVVVTFNYLRHFVFWLPTEDVAFESDGVQIRGTLIKPSDDGVHPAVVILHGSGPESRSGPGYRVISNAIARSGLAVLFYDKRGVGESGGDFGSATYADFVADGVAAVRYLASRDDIDADKIGLEGNSEGGWFTPEIAYTSGQVAFIFNRVGPPLSWVENVIWEVRNDFMAAGVAESDVELLEAVTRRRWNYYIAAASDSSLATGTERDAINAELARLRNTVPVASDVLSESLLPYDAAEYASIAADYSYDPRPFLEAIDIPMIYTFGETDINVPTARSVEFLESFRSRYSKNIDIVVYENVGHPMAHWSGAFTGGYVPEFLDLLGDWHREQVSGKPADQ